MDDFLVQFIDDLIVEASTATINRKRRNEAGLCDAFELSDHAFMKHFRLSKALTRELIEEIEPYLQQKNISTKSKIFSALCFLGTGSYQHLVGSDYLMELSQSSVSRNIQEVVEALNNPRIFNKWVHFPRTYAELNCVVQGFYAKYRFPGVVGAIDGTHVAIVPPSNENYDERSFVNRKNYHSINVQLICDVNLKILNVNAKYPGSSHDSYIFNNSNVSLLMENLHNQGHSHYHLIGDSGYALRPWMMTPIIPQPDSNTAEERYNHNFKKIRATIERCNGVIKQRFRCLLKDRVLHYKPEKANKIINACVVLHNMCIKANVPLPPDEAVSEDQLGMVLQEPPDLPQNRMNSQLIMGRHKRNNIINQYFN